MIKAGPATKYVRKKDEEKARSKGNRKNFKGLIEDLNKSVSDVKLKKNSSLAIAVALVKLNSFYSPNTVNTERAGTFGLCQLLKVSDAIGVGFLKDGIIVYATDALKEYFKDIRHLVGSHLEKISYNSFDIIKRVFDDKETDFVLQVKGMYKYKASFDLCIKGKEMSNVDNDASMFLGYSKIKPFQMYKNPSLSMSGCYMVTSLDLKVLKGHPYVDFLLNTQMKGTASVMYPHGDDLKDTEKLFGGLRKTGFAETLIRLLRKADDGTYTYVHCVMKLSIFTDVNGVSQIASLLWPFGSSNEGDHFTQNDFEMLASNPSMGRDIQMYRKQFDKAVANSEGIFSEPYTLNDVGNEGIAPEPLPLKQVPKPDPLISNPSPTCVSPETPQYATPSEQSVPKLTDAARLLKRANETYNNYPSLQTYNNSPSTEPYNSPPYNSPPLPQTSVLYPISSSSTPSYSGGGVRFEPLRPNIIKAEPTSPNHCYRIHPPPPERSTYCNSYTQTSPNRFQGPVMDLPDLLPTIDPKLEMIDFIDTMPTTIIVPDSTAQSPASSIHNSPGSSRDYHTPPVIGPSPPPALPQPQPPEAHLDESVFSFEPPVEIIEFMDEFWSTADLF